MVYRRIMTFRMISEKEILTHSEPSTISLHIRDYLGKNCSCILQVRIASRKEVMQNCKTTESHLCFIDSSFPSSGIEFGSRWFGFGKHLCLEASTFIIIVIVPVAFIFATATIHLVFSSVQKFLSIGRSVSFVAHPVIFQNINGIIPSGFFVLNIRSEEVQIEILYSYLIPIHVLVRILIRIPVHLFPSLP